MPPPGTLLDYSLQKIIPGSVENRGEGNLLTVFFFLFFHFFILNYRVKEEYLMVLLKYIFISWHIL